MKKNTYKDGLGLQCVFLERKSLEAEYLNLRTLGKDEDVLVIDN